MLDIIKHNTTISDISEHKIIPLKQYGIRMLPCSACNGFCPTNSEGFLKKIKSLKENPFTVYTHTCIHKCYHIHLYILNTQL